MAENPWTMLACGMVRIYRLSKIIGDFQSLMNTINFNSTTKCDLMWLFKLRFWFFADLESDFAHLGETRALRTQVV